MPVKAIAHAESVRPSIQPQSNCPSLSRIDPQGSSISLGYPPLRPLLIPPQMYGILPSHQSGRSRRRPRVWCPSRPSLSKHTSPRTRSSSSVPLLKQRTARSGEKSMKNLPTKKASHYDQTSLSLTLPLLLCAALPRALCILGLPRDTQGASGVPPLSLPCS